MFTVADPKELFYVPDPKNFPVRRYHTSRPLQYKAASIKTPNMSIDIQSIIASDWFNEDSHETDLPFLPQEIMKMLHNFGYSMLLDDKHDIGKFGYPGHPSGAHHWYVGAAMMVIAQIGGMIQKMREFMEVGATMGLDQLGIEETIPSAAPKAMPKNIPLFGNPPEPLKAIAYNDAIQPRLPGVLQNQYLNRGRIYQLPNSMLKPTPQLPGPATKSIAPNPLKGLVNR